MQKTEVITGNGTFLFLEIPDDADDFEILNKGFSRSSAFLNICWNNEEKCIPYIDEKQPLKLYDEEDFQIISATKDITEEQSYIVIDSSDDYGENDWSYNKNYVTGDWLLKSSKESLQSLIQANGLDINKNYLIVKKL